MGTVRKTGKEMKNTKKHLIFSLALMSACLVATLQPAAGGDFNYGTTAGWDLIIRDNNKKTLKTFTRNGSDRSLSGTGLSGTVVDCKDHWRVQVTGGTLYGSIHTQTGLEICLEGSPEVYVISTLKDFQAIQGSGVRICGSGKLTIDQRSNYSAIDGTDGTVAITLGAAVTVMGINVTKPAVKGKGIRVSASTLHVNSGNMGMHCTTGGLNIGESIVSVCSSGVAFYQNGDESNAVTGSCVHLISTKASAIQSGSKSLSVVNSVFCALGAGHGIQGAGSKIAFDNVIGVIAGKDCGIYSASKILVSGGSTKLSMAGNITRDHKPGNDNAIDYVDNHHSAGQCIYSSASSQSYFGLKAGKVQLFSPGVCALDCGTNVVSGGRLEIPAKGAYRDFQTLFTWQGATSAAAIFMGRSLFQSDFYQSDFGNIFDAFADITESAYDLFSLYGAAKTRTGVSADSFEVTGGEVSVEASGVGIHLGGCYSSRGAFLNQKGGRISVESDRVAIADDDAVDGYVSREADNSRIIISGGELTARGGWDGILTCGDMIQQGGTVEVAATGGDKPGTMSSKPGLIGYALSANKGVSRAGGSLVVTAGALRTTSAAAVTLALSASSRSFSAAAASSKELGVTANVSWTAKSSVSWLSVKTSSGKGNGKIVYNVAANAGTSSRTGKITVAGGGLTRTFSVTQNGNSGGGTATLTLGASERSFAAAAANSKELGVTANVSWTAKSSASWLAVKTASGKGNGKIVYNVGANKGSALRTAKITVTGGGLTRTFTVTQSGKSATLTLGAGSRTFTASAENSKELAVTANVSWTAKSSASWLAVKTTSGSGNGKIVYNVAENTGETVRTGTITVSGGGLTRTFTVTQCDSDTQLELEESGRSFTAEGVSSMKLHLRANVEWSMESSAPWLRVAILGSAGGVAGGGSAMGSTPTPVVPYNPWTDTIIYDVAENTGSLTRTATITVSGGGLTRTFTVTQYGMGQKSLKAKTSVGRVWVTTSDGTDGSAVVDGNEGTGWSPSEAEGAWVALTLEEERPVDGVEVVGENLPDGMQVLVSVDGDTWSEERGDAVSYLWVLLPGEGVVPTVREILTEP